MNVSDFDTLYAGRVIVTFDDEHARPMDMLASIATWKTTALEEANQKRDFLMNYYENQQIKLKKIEVRVLEVGSVQAGRIAMLRKPRQCEDY